MIDSSFDLDKTYTLWSGLIGGLFLMLAYFGCDQSQVQRYLTAKSDRDARNSLYMSAIFKIPLQLLVLSLGVLIFVFYELSGPAPEVSDVNYIFPTFILTQLPVGAVGLMIAAIFAAAMSSISSELNALATTSVMDIYQRLIKPSASNQHYLLVSKVCTCLWGVFACVVAYFASSLGALIEVVNLFGSYFYGSLLGVFVLAFFGKKCSSNSAFYGLFFGIAAVALVALNTNISFLWYNLVGVLAVVAFGTIWSLIEIRNVESNAKR